MNVPPYVISAARETESQLRWSMESLEATVDATARWVSSRVGKTISAASASKIQAAIDALTSAEDAYANAKKGLQVLISFAGAAEDDVPEKGSSGMTAKNLKGFQSIGSGRAADHQSRPGGLRRMTLADQVRSRKEGEAPPRPWDR